MSTVFPVEFEIYRDTGEKSSLLLFQSFTRDVSAGGMCVECKSFGKETEKRLLAPNTFLKLFINPAFASCPIEAVGRIVWIRKKEENSSIYLIGVAYTQIDNVSRSRLIRHARWLFWLPRALGVVGTVMACLLIVLLVHSQALVRENKKLVNQLIAGAEKKSSVAMELYELQKRKLQLENELTKARDQANVEKQKDLDAQLTNLQAGRQELEAAYQNLQQAGNRTESANLRQMYGWLKSHQNLKTGLVASFEGDSAIEDWGFTYDQSLACQTFLLFGDIKDAAAILSFYELHAERAGGAFFFAFDVSYGSAAASTVHVGPNVWLGIAAVQYEYAVHDGRFKKLAIEIGDWTLRAQDSEGGLKGGPDFSWYSTEHNLDAYAFFGMLYEITKDARYKTGQERVLSWIKKYAYSMKEKRLNRGKGDATIATDTFSWAVAALGPETLKKIEFDAEAIMDFAEKNCEVTVRYKLPNGKFTTVKGFDFAKAQHVGRGGVISTEWTGQVIVTYQVLADYFQSAGDKEKSALYRAKAVFYLNELQKLVITSPSRTGQGKGCLPYASLDNVDTGHGWRTPQGNRTGSVAGTSYGIFAWRSYNPFSLSERKK